MAAAKSGAAERDPLALRDRLIVELLYASAIRVSELVGLRQSDVDHAQLTVRVRGKGDKERVVPFGIPAAEALAAYLAARPALVARSAHDTGALFVGARGGAISTRRLP